MENDVSASSRDYHFKTSYDRFRMSGHSLDWHAQPSVFKAYPDADLLALPQITEWPACGASEVHRGEIRPDPDSEFDTRRLSSILTLCHALTAKTTHGDVDFYYRSVASAGALYPFEVYIGVSRVQGLADGIYHHNVAARALTLLRPGDSTDDVVRGLRTTNEMLPIVSFFLTAIFYRSSWKYRDRGYRYHLLDTGHLAENLSQALGAFRAPFQLHYDFDDALINDLLCLDAKREVCLVVAAATGKPCAETESAGPPRVPVNPRSASKVASTEVEYPLILETHQESSRVVQSELEPQTMIEALGVRTTQRIRVSPPVSLPEVEGYVDAIFKRRSLRNFVRTELSADRFKALVHMVCSDADSQDRSVDHTLMVGLLVGNVEGMESGFYVLDRRDTSLIPLASGFMMDTMASTCLHQAWLANCSLHFLFLSNLRFIETLWGARAYRYAMLSAGRLGQRIYVGATAMHMGCCGIGAFYDDEARRLLALPDDWNLLYLVAAGPVKKWTLGATV